MILLIFQALIIPKNLSLNFNPLVDLFNLKVIHSFLIIHPIYLKVLDSLLIVHLLYLEALSFVYHILHYFLKDFEFNFLNIQFKFWRLLLMFSFLYQDFQCIKLVDLVFLLILLFDSIAIRFLYLSF